MTAPPTRHEETLHASTLQYLERESARNTRVPDVLTMGDLYAYAAQCVSEVAALRAENATLRERAAIVEAMERGECAVWPSSTTTDGKVASFGIAVAGRLFDIAARATHKETGDGQ